MLYYKYERDDGLMYVVSLYLQHEMGEVSVYPKHAGGLPAVYGLNHIFLILFVKMTLRN